MSAEDPMQKAAGEARYAVQKAREFADLFEEYAWLVTQSNKPAHSRQKYGEAMRALELVREVVESSDAWMDKSGPARREEGREQVNSAEDGDTFTLHFTTSNDPNPGEPYESPHRTLADALAEAWINDIAGGLSLRITRGGEVVFTEDALQRAFGRLRTLEAEEAGGDRRTWAQRVIKEMGKERH